MKVLKFILTIVVICTGIYFYLVSSIFKEDKKSAVAIIGSSDGPTAIFISKNHNFIKNIILTVISFFVLNCCIKK